VANFLIMSLYCADLHKVNSAWPTLCVGTGEPTVNRCNKYSQTLAVNRSCVCSGYCKLECILPSEALRIT